MLSVEVPSEIIELKVVVVVRGMQWGSCGAGSLLLKVIGKNNQISNQNIYISLIYSNNICLLN